MYTAVYKIITAGHRTFLGKSTISHVGSQVGFSSSLITIKAKLLIQLAQAILNSINSLPTTLQTLSCPNDVAVHVSKVI